MKFGFSNAANNLSEDFTQKSAEFLNWFKKFMTWGNVFKALSGLIVILLFWISYKLIKRGIKKIPDKKLPGQSKLIIQKISKYTIYTLCGMYILSLFGIRLSTIWGAAGIAGIAIGFAAQTSVSNIISGIFVITEGSLKIGDTIIVNDITGIIDSINLLSIRVHTYDNQMVRIPNSTIINSNLINNSYHKIRRMTINVEIAYDTDMQKALDCIKKVPDLCPTVLAEPKANAWFDGFGESGIKLTLALWFKIEDFIDTKNAAYINIKKCFDEEGIEIPFMQVDLHLDDEKNLK